MIERTGCSCCSDLPIERNLDNIKFFHRKANTLAKVMESTLEQYCNVSKGNINSEEAICK